MTTLLIALFGAGLVFLMVYFYITFRVMPDKKVHQRLRDITGNGADAASSDKLQHDTGKITDKPFLSRTIIPFIHSLEEKLLQLTPKGIYSMIDHRLTLAGKESGVSVFLLICFVTIICGFFFGVSLLNDEMPFVQKIAIMIFGVIFGAAVPFIFLNGIINKRKALITKQLPELLDLLCVSVQAGLSFDGAISKILTRMKGPLIDECERMQRDVRMGMPRKRSLQQMANRCDVQEVYLFTTAVIQAERLGTSMATTLENQADNMRERRRQNAKAEALKAPVKIVFPLVLFIFPALFVVVLLPSLLLLMKSM